MSRIPIAHQRLQPTIVKIFFTTDHSESRKTAKIFSQKRARTGLRKNEKPAWENVPPNNRDYTNTLYDRLLLASVWRQGFHFSNHPSMGCYNSLVGKANETLSERETKFTIQLGMTTAKVTTTTTITTVRSKVF